MPPTQLLQTIIFSYCLCGVLFWSGIKFKRAEISRQGKVTFILMGALLATIRIGIYFYLSHRQITHTMYKVIPHIELALYPELSILSQTAIGRLENMGALIGCYCIALSVGSFLWSIPFLFYKSTAKIKQAI